MQDFAIARLNMVESQVRPNGITDSRIITAMMELPREQFVPADRQALAYMDEDIPLGTGPRARLMTEPMVLARLIQLAAIKETDKVLHIGAATGYGSAVLARLGAQVVAVEEDPALAATAGSNLTQMGNVKVVAESRAHGHAGDGPYDVIMIEGRVPEVPDLLANQLSEGGRLVAVVGDNVVSRGVIITRSGTSFSQQRGFDATVRELPGFSTAKPEFVF